MINVWHLYELEVNAEIPEGLIASGYCPIDLNISDSYGRFINKTYSDFPDSVYREVDLNFDGELDDQVYIPYPLEGLYTIEVEPEPWAEPDDTYSLQMSYKNESYFLAEDVEISDIPPEGYGLSWPNKPNTPDGPLNGKVGESNTYTSASVDPDGDEIRLLFDWGDGTNSGWIETGEASYSWSEKGTYEIKVKAKDIHDFKSDWSDPLTVTITKSKNRNINNPFLIYLQNFLSNHPTLFPLLQRLTFLRLGLQ